MGNEEEVAREVLGIIRDGLLEYAKIGGERNPPRLAVKFCGGCNPQVDRGSILKTIQEGLGKQVCWVAGGEKADLLIILNGCLASCADRPDVKEKIGRTLIVSGNVVCGIEEIQAKCL